MQVKLLVSRSGVMGAQNVGDVIPVDDAEGERMISAGQAVKVQAKSVERAVKRAPKEKAIK